MRRLLAAIILLCVGGIACSIVCEKTGHWQPEGAAMIEILASVILFLATVALGIVQLWTGRRRRR